MAESRPSACPIRLRSSKVKGLTAPDAQQTQKVRMFKRLPVCVLAGALLLSSAAAFAQQPAVPAAPAAPAGGQTICGQPVPSPRALPPAGSAPVVYLIAPCFEAQENQSLVDLQTYLYYIQTKASQPSQGIWIPYNEDAETSIRDDFKRLWGTNFLDNLSIQVSDPQGTPGSTFTDYVFSNGVVGKLITYQMEERQRVKIVDYTGSKKLETSKIDEKRKEANAQIRLDTFIDPALIRKIEGVIRDMMKEKRSEERRVGKECA